MIQLSVLLSLSKKRERIDYGKPVQRKKIGYNSLQTEQQGADFFSKTVNVRRAGKLCAERNILVGKCH